MAFQDIKVHTTSYSNMYTVLFFYFLYLCIFVFMYFTVHNLSCFFSYICMYSIFHMTVILLLLRHQKLEANTLYSLFWGFHAFKKPFTIVLLPLCYFLHAITWRKRLIKKNKKLYWSPQTFLSAILCGFFSANVI